MRSSGLPEETVGRCTLDEGLFDLDHEPQTAPVQAPGPAPIQDRQIEQIRNLFRAAGIAGQEDRRVFVESIVETRVASLRSLSHFHAVRVIEALSKRGRQPTGRKGSAWDEREEDTWIDRL
jgi:DNA polymerase-3 subunit epsilon